MRPVAPLTMIPILRVAMWQLSFVVAGTGLAALRTVTAFRRDQSSTSDQVRASACPVSGATGGSVPDREHPGPQDGGDAPARHRRKAPPRDTSPRPPPPRPRRALA